MKKPTYQEFYDAVVEDYRPSSMLTGEAFDRAIKENEDVIEDGYNLLCYYIEHGPIGNEKLSFEGQVYAASYNLYMLI